MKRASKPSNSFSPILFGWVWLCLFTSLLTAATNTFVPYSVRSWQTDEGLPQNSVHALAQTPEGYLWVGTREGLARFDGVRFQTMDLPDAPELRHGWITTMSVAIDGTLWIGCEGVGVLGLRAGAVTRLTETNGLPNNQPRCLLQAKDGSLWIGTEGGLARYHNGALTNFSTRTGLADNSVRALCEDRQGNLRIATRRGLCTLSPDGIITSTNFEGFLANVLKSVCEDRAGNIWLAANDGVRCLEGDDRAFYGVSEGLPGKIATVVFEDSQGQLWIGTYRGLSCIVNREVISKPLSERVFGDLINVVFEDAERNLWIGGRDGLYRLNPGRFHTLTTQEGLSCDNTMSVLEDRSGAIWIATWGGGINRLEKGSIACFGSTNGLTYDETLSLHQGSDSSLWIGMDNGGGLNRLNHDCRNSFPKQESMPAIRVIHEDRRGALWLGTSKGLLVYEHDKFRTFGIPQGLPGETVLAICEAPDGTLWLGTDSGLSCFRDGKFENFTTQEGLPNNLVQALYLDGDRTLWIGTKGGLSRLKDNQFRNCTSRHGLFSDDIYEIVEDDYGYFWMSCRNGLFRANKQQLQECADGRRSTVGCTSFGKADGLLSVQCNGVAKPAACKDRLGRLWFPTIRGVVAVDSRLKTNERPPPVMIEEVVADKKPLSPGTSSEHSMIPSFHPSHALKILPGRGELEIRYTALSFQTPEKNRFKYRLGPMQTDWVDAGSRRIANYNNLAPGRYDFQVIACNNDGVWSEEGTALALVLLPHYWQTWWFKVGLGAAFAALLMLLYRSRLARFRELERLRIQIAADLHDDVGARLTKVAMVTELLDRQVSQTDRSKPQIQNLTKTTREVIRAMDEIVWTINPKNDTLDNLANYIFQYAQEYFQNTTVRCRLDLPARLPDYSISTEQRHNFFMAVKEALNNVLKHSRATEVRISLSVNDSKLLITITDDGCGFSPDRLDGSGDGLVNMKARIARIGGHFNLQTSPGAGTTIKLESDT